MTAGRAALALMILGAACVVAGAFLVGGIGVALVVGGVALVLAAYDLGRSR